MYSINRMSPSRPLCNNIGRMGLDDQKPKEVNQQPEYLGNEHLKFLNKFGAQEHFVNDRKFVDINNAVNCHRPNPHVGLNSSYILQANPNSVMVNCTANYHTCAHNRPEEPLMQPNWSRKSPPRDPNTSQGCSGKKLQKFRTCNEKLSSDEAMHSKETKRRSARPKRTHDRHQTGKRSKPWHKTSLEKELMEIDDYTSSSELDQSFESPTAASLPSPIPECYTPIFFPLKISPETNRKVQSSISPLGCESSEFGDIHLGSSPKQNFRPRLPSECESEDSFIVFEETSSCCDVDDGESADFESSSEEDSDESDDDDADVVDFCAIKCNQNNRLRSSSPTKKVTFASGKDLCEVHPMVQWSFAYQKARKGPWEQCALDRVRFKNRVSGVQPILDAILQPGHRGKVFQERFQQDADN